jgi:hypothetical protein
MPPPEISEEDHTDGQEQARKILESLSGGRRAPGDGLVDIGAILVASGMGKP